MKDRSLVNPQLLPYTTDPVPLKLDRITEIRRERAIANRIEDPPSIIPQIVQIPCKDHKNYIEVRIFVPSFVESKIPFMLTLHGGGFITGAAQTGDVNNARLAEMHHMIVASISYRLAPESTFPEPQEDCYSALKYFYDHADQWGIDQNRMMIRGESSGGGLAAAVALMVRDRAEFPLIGQILIYPMLDYRTGGKEERNYNPTTGHYRWDRAMNQMGWNALRGNYDLSDNRVGYFSPSLESNLQGLPFTFIAVGAIDLFMEEDTEYMRQLSCHGVEVSFHIYPGAWHGFDRTPTAVAWQLIEDEKHAIAYILEKTKR